MSNTRSRSPSDRIGWAVTALWSVATIGALIGAFWLHTNIDKQEYHDITKHCESYAQSNEWSVAHVWKDHIMIQLYPEWSAEQSPIAAMVVSGNACCYFGKSELRVLSCEPLDPYGTKYYDIKLPETSIES